MAAEHVLAVDQGTTGTTVVVVGPDGRVAGRGYAELGQHYPRPGWVEHDPEEIWTVTRRVASAALADAGLRGTDLAGVGITNQRETTVLWERDTGRPVAPAIVWQDRRTARFCRRLEHDGLGPMIRRKTGLLVDAYFSGTKIRWLLDNVEGLRGRAERGEIAFGTIDSWLLARCTGGRVHATDPTNASRTLLMDLDALTWDDELCEVLGVPPAVLPEIRPSATVFGETDTEVFGASLPIAGVLGDQQSALFAQACFEPGQVKNTYGTGSFVLMNTGVERPADTERLIATVACGFEDAPTEYALEGSIFVTGAAVQWLRDQLGIIRVAAETERLAASLDSNDDVYLVPALTGLGAPHWDPYARGVLVGFTLGTTPAHLARATLEGTGFSTRDVIEEMRAASGGPVTELRADGGAAENNWLMQFQADILGVPVDVPEVVERTSLGAAYLAGLVTGVWDDRDELKRRWRSHRRFEPVMGEGEREALYRRWRQALRLATGWASEGAASEGAASEGAASEEAASEGA